MTQTDERFENTLHWNFYTGYRAKLIFHRQVILQSSQELLWYHSAQLYGRLPYVMYRLK